MVGSISGGSFQVRIGEHDQWPFSPEFGGERNDVSGGGHADVTCGFRGTGEGDATDSMIGDESGADLVANALNDVEDAGRNPDFVGEISQQGRR